MMRGQTRFGTSRGVIFAFICLGLLAAGCSKSDDADGPLDTSRLPRVTGAKEIFAGAATTIFTSPDSVAQTADTVGKTLAAAGWQAYAAPNTQQAVNPSLRIMSLKRGPQALTVFISLAPAQGNATSVSYTAVALKNDLPFPKDASNIEFDPDKLIMTGVSAESIDTTLINYRKQLETLGWRLWSAKTGEKQAPGGPAGVVHERGAYAHYVNDKQISQALVLVLQRRDDGRINVDLKGWPIGVLEAEHKAELNRNKPKDATPAAAAEPPQAKAAPIAPQPEKAKSAADEMADEILKQAQKAIGQATADAISGLKAQAPAPAAQGSETPLRVLAGNSAPVPLPETAEEITFDAAGGKLEFNSPSSIKALSEFYRSTMKQQGWEQQSSVINNANMVVLNFSNGRKAASFTIMRMGDKANVTADGSALVTAAAKPAVPDAAPAVVQADNTPSTDALAQKASEDDLIAEESGGLPVPKRHTTAAGSKTPFRREMSANVPLDLATVLSFYRRELGKLNWKEESKGTVVAADRAVIAFSSTDGPALLKLGRKDGETSVSLVTKNPDAAAKAGMVPKPGQSKLMLGNPMPVEAEVTINKQTIKVAAGVGAKAPNGPTLDLAPGKYKFSVKLPGMPLHNDELDVGADETWGLLIGPGGALPLQAY